MRDRQSNICAQCLSNIWILPDALDCVGYQRLEARMHLCSVATIKANVKSGSLKLAYLPSCLLSAHPYSSLRV